MKVKTKDLISECEARGLSQKLTRAAIRQSGGWESFCENAVDIARHGIDGGFSGWIYHYETQTFAVKHRADIAAYLERMADDMGESTISMVKGFRCVNDATDAEVGKCLYGRMTDDDAGILNAMAWVVIEEIARAYDDMIEA